MPPIASVHWHRSGTPLNAISGSMQRSKCIGQLIRHPAIRRTDDMEYLIIPL
jgi:hypothetical protein